MSKYDFHVHSNNSDGKWTVDELISCAKNIGMKGIILTDHDTLTGQEKFIQKATEAGMKVSSGIEMSTTFDDKECHILGYGFDLKNATLTNKLETNREAREKRNVLIIEKLRKLGFTISDEKLAEERKKAGGYQGRLLIAITLLNEPKNHSLIKDLSIKGVFDQYLGDEGDAHVLVERMTPFEAIELIHGAGGIASLAHPGETFSNTKEFEAIVTSFVKAGLDAIEVYSYKHTPSQTKYYKKFAQKKGLLVTFGSDDHGWPQIDRTIGVTKVENEEETAQKLFTRLNSLQTS